MLHSEELGVSPMLIEDNIFNKTLNRLEYEANLFTAEILLPDDEILEYAYNGNTQVVITLAMRSDVNLLAMKIDS